MNNLLILLFLSASLRQRCSTCPYLPVILHDKGRKLKLLDGGNVPQVLHTRQIFHLLLDLKPGECQEPPSGHLHGRTNTWKRKWWKKRAGISSNSKETSKTKLACAYSHAREQKWSHSSTKHKHREATNDSMSITVFKTKNTLSYYESMTEPSRLTLNHQLAWTMNSVAKFLLYLKQSKEQSQWMERIFIITTYTHITLTDTHTQSTYYTD